MDSLDEQKKATKGLIFASKFKSIPLIISTRFWLSENYCKLKKANILTKTTCNLAETTLNLAVPMLSKFKNQACFVDALASNQLDQLIALFTLLINDTNNLLNQTKNVINHFKVEPKKQIVKILYLNEKICHQMNMYHDFLVRTSKFVNLNKNETNNLRPKKQHESINLHRNQKIPFKYELKNTLNASMDLFLKAVGDSVKNLDWFVPNFAVLCVLNEDDMEDIDLNHPSIERHIYSNEHSINRNIQINMIIYFFIIFFVVYFIFF